MVHNQAERWCRSSGRDSLKEFLVKVAGNRALIQPNQVRLGPLTVVVDVVVVVVTVVVTAEMVFVVVAVVVVVTCTKN